MLQPGSENLTSTAPAPIAGAEDLLALASQVDGEIAAPAPGSPAALELERKAELEPKITLEQELAGMFAMIGTGVGQWLPRTGAVLTTADDKGKSAADHLGDALAPVARKYGLDRYIEGFAWRLELQALMVVGPIVLAIKDAARADLAELDRKQREAERGGAPANDRSEELRDRARAHVAELGAEAAASSSIAPPAAAPGLLQPISGYLPQ